MTDIKVTQADREAAAKAIGFHGRRIGVDTDIRNCGSDEHPLVQSHARHRIEAQRPLLEALERLMGSIMERTKGDYAGSWDNALAAIKQAKGE